MVNRVRPLLARRYLEVDAPAEDVQLAEMEEGELLPARTDLGVIVLTRGPDRYVFVFLPARRYELLRVAGRFAANPKLSFNWHDAAEVTKIIHKI